MNMYHNNRMNPTKYPKKNNNIFQPNIKVYQSPNQQNQNLIYNNNAIKNYDIRVNKIKPAVKEKIIEGELNFNNNNKNIIHHNRIPNNVKQRKQRNKPTKSPVPLPKDYKPSNYQKLFNNHHIPNTNSLIKPKSAVPRKNNFISNNNNNALNKNILKPNTNHLGLSSNFTSNKTYNAFNIFKKQLDRKQSPFQRTSYSNNPGNNFIQKNQIKSRHTSKSPILSKNYTFNKYKMRIFGVGNNNNISGSSNNSNNSKNTKKKTPIKNNEKKQIITNKKQNFVNNYNHNVNNGINNLRAKGPTLIQGELLQESSEETFNINKKHLSGNINYNNNENNNLNLKPVYNSQNLKIESNNALLNIQGENYKNDLNNIQPISKEIKVENKNNNLRSQSTGINNPLQKDAKEKEKEQLEQPQLQIKKEKIKEREKQEENKKGNKYITKKIKEILPYTHVGFDGEEPKENNQDNYFIYKNFMNKKDYIYMSVCDGHGIEGHFVSGFMKEILPYDMSENLKSCNLMTENEKEKEKIYQIIKETFIIANEKLVDNEDINSLFSGSTCVSVIYTPEKLIVPNIGDSRAVLGRLINKEKNEYKAIDLSRDHKPTEKDEAQRIIENDGRIQPFTEEGEFVGPQRVWIKEEEVPGLAMTRSFGDRVAATVGVMSEPEIKEFLFDEGDKFMIIASDGIWEFISSQECVDIIKDFYDKNDLKGCCEYLYQESSKRWLKEEEVIDDTTLILVFFE